MKLKYLIAATLFALVIALGWLVGTGATVALDKSLYQAIVLRDGVSPAWQIKAAQWITWLGDGERRTIMIVALAAWLVWERRYKAGLVAAVVPYLGAATSSILKEAFARPRPTLAPHLDVVGDLSFPSGHAAAGAVLIFAALILPLRHRLLSLFGAVTVTALIGLSRPLLGVHWPSDVVGGWLLGLSVAIAGTAIVRQWEGK